MLDSNIRLKNYRSASDKQKYFFSEPTQGELLRSIAQKYDFHKDDTYAILVTTVGDIILGFYRIEDTVPLLQQELGLDPRTAALLGADVLDFLAPLSDPHWQPPEKAIEEEWGNETNEGSANTERSTQGATLSPTDLPQASPITTTSYSPAPTAPPPIYNHEPSVIPPPTTTYQPVGTPALPPQPPIPPAAPTVPQPPQSAYSALDQLASRSQNTPPVTPPQPYMQPVSPSLNLGYEPVYRATPQDNLRQPLSNVPTYTPPVTGSPTPPKINEPDPPRWSTG